MLGREDDADITLHDPLVSKRHVRFGVSSVVEVVDLGWATGSRTRAGGVSAGANGLTALAYSAGINGGIGSAGSEASYLALNHSDLSWKGAIGAFAGGGTGRGRQWWRWTCVRHYREKLS